MAVLDRINQHHRAMEREEASRGNGEVQRVSQSPRLTRMGTHQLPRSPDDRELHGKRQGAQLHGDLQAENFVKKSTTTPAPQPLTADEERLVRADLTDLVLFEALLQ